MVAMAEEQHATTATRPPEEGYRRLTRDPERRVLAGVCTGLGRFTGIDPVVYRVGFAILVLAHGQGILLYIAAALLMPGRPGESSAAEKLFKRWLDGAGVLSVLGALLCAGVALSLFGGVSTDSIAVLTVFGLVLLVAHARGVDLVGTARSFPERLAGHPPRPAPAYGEAAFQGSGSGTSLHQDVFGTSRGAAGGGGGLPEGMIDLATLGSPRTPGAGPGTPPGDDGPYGTGFPFPGAAPYPGGTAGATAAPARTRAPRAKSPLTPITLLAAMAAAAAMTPVAHGREPLDAALVIMAPALAVVGLGMVLGAWFRVRGLATVGALLTVALLTTSAATAVPADMRYMDVDWRPTDATLSHQEYRLGIGTARLDLTALPVDRGRRVTIDAKVTAGDLRVAVPRATRVVLDARVGLGDLSVGGRTISGPNAKSADVLEPEGAAVRNPPEIVLRIRARLGDVKVTRD